MMLTVAYFAHKNDWGADIAFSWPRMGKRVRRDSAHRRRLSAGAVLPVVERRRCGGIVALRRAAGRAVRRRQAVQVRGRAWRCMTPVHPDRRHDDAACSRRPRRAVAAVVWALFLGLVWYRTLTWRMLVKVVDGHHRDHGDGAVHRRRGVDLRLGADRPRSVTDAIAAWVLSISSAARGCSCCWPTCLLLFVGCFLETDRRDHDPGADADADRRASSASTRSTSAWSWC